MHYIQPLIGAAVILGIGYLFSTNRRAINWTRFACCCRFAIARRAGAATERRRRLLSHRRRDSRA